jgi:hypothetical protein
MYCFAPTSQTVKFLVLLLGESISVLRYEVGSNFLWAAPRGVTEGTLGLLLMLVPRVPSQFLGASILSSAIFTAILIPEFLIFVLGIQDASRICMLILLNTVGN